MISPAQLQGLIPKGLESALNKVASPEVRLSDRLCRFSTLKSEYIMFIAHPSSPS